MYNTLYIGFANVKGNTLIYTSIGNESDVSKSYRAAKWKECMYDYEMDLSRSFYVRCKDYDECRHLQRTLLEVCKGWVYLHCRILFPGYMSKEIMQGICKRLLLTFDSQDRHKVRAAIIETLNRYYPLDAHPGFIYLVEVKGKYKIGLTRDPWARTENLAERYGSCTTLDIRATERMEYDEMMLQMKCSAYKAKEILYKEQKVDENYCSELYDMKQEVLDIWENYWR